MNELRKMYLTVFYSGMSPFASGTMGTIASLFMAYVLLHFQLVPMYVFFILAVVLSFVSIPIIDSYERDTGTHDGKEIVIDELVGMWFAMSLGSINFITVAPELMVIHFSFILVISFTLFRILDILKPSYIGKIDRDVDGGWGVMGDDILAGVLAGILTCVFTNVLFYTITLI